MFLKVRDAAFLLECSTSAIYNMINTYRLKAINPSKRLTRIRQVDVFSILDERIQHDYELLEKKRSKREGYALSKNYYRIDEITAIFRKSKEAMYAYCRRHHVAKIKTGREILLAKHDIEELYRKFIGVRYIGLEKERKANWRLAKKKFKKEDCYSMKECSIVFGKPRELLYGLFSRRCIPRIKMGRNIFIPKIAAMGMFNLIKKGVIVRKVTLRKKPITKGRKSLFLDIYPPVPNKDNGKLTRKFYLGLFIYHRPATDFERQHNKETLIVANVAMAKSQLIIQKMDYKAFFEYLEKAP